MSDLPQCIACGTDDVGSVKIVQLAIIREVRRIQTQHELQEAYLCEDCFGRIMGRDYFNEPESPIDWMVGNVKWIGRHDQTKA